MEVEWKSVVITWREGDQADEIKALVAQLRIRFKERALKVLVVDSKRRSHVN